MARRGRGEAERYSQPTTEFRRRGPRELGALALVAVGIFLALALATFDRNDPTLFGGVGDTARNWMGPAGHTVALALRIALGAMSYGVPLVLFGAAVLVATSASVRSPWRRMAAVPFFLAATTGLLDRLLVDAHPLSGGGALGQLVGGRMEPLFNPLGTYLILGLVGLVSVLAMTRVSIGRVLGVIGALLAGAREDAARYLAAFREWWIAWSEGRAQARAERLEARAAARAEAEAEAAAEEETRREPTVELDAPEDEDEEEEEPEEEPAFISEPATVSEDEDTEAEEADWEDDEEEIEDDEEVEEEEEDSSAATTASVEIHTEVPEGESTEDWATDEEAAPTARERQRKFRFLSDRPPFRLPSLSLLDTEGRRTREIDRELLLANADLLEKRLAEYGVQAKVKAVHPGPVITRYELEPAPGVKVNRIMSLADDLSLAMRAHSIRILAPVPGKAVVGIEIPNEQRETVYLKDIIGAEAFKNESLRLPIALGQDISGNPAVADMVKMPHLLIAGATGSGKSVAINTIILSFLYKASPDEVKLIMIDPKMLELNLYEGIPHLMLPVVTDMRKAALALRWAVQEMERRYKLLSKASVRNIEGYNIKVAEELARIDATPGERERMEEEGEEPPPEKLRYIIVVIDELADMMMVASKDVEESITRLAQMARAAGIHLIVATQRPSVDVITGIIKANFPARISFKVSARHDSRTILDAIGAERLLGQGDMLMLAPGTSKVVRIHGAFVSEREIMKITKFLRQQGSPVYDESILEVKESEAGADDDDYDEKYDEALAYVAQLGHASISLVQRRFRIGYNRAARIIEKMEREGVLGPAEGAGKPRPVLVNSYDG